MSDSYLDYLNCASKPVVPAGVPMSRPGFDWHNQPEHSAIGVPPGRIMVVTIAQLLHLLRKVQGTTPDEADQQNLSYLCKGGEVRQFVYNPLPGGSRVAKGNPNRVYLGFAAGSGSATRLGLSIDFATNAGIGMSSPAGFVEFYGVKHALLAQHEWFAIGQAGAPLTVYEVGGNLEMAS